MAWIEVTVWARDPPVPRRRRGAFRRDFTEASVPGDADEEVLDEEAVAFGCHWLLRAGRR